MCPWGGHIFILISQVSPKVTASLIQKAILPNYENHEDRPAAYASHPVDGCLIISVSSTKYQPNCPLPLGPEGTLDFLVSLASISPLIPVEMVDLD